MERVAQDDEPQGPGEFFGRRRDERLRAMRGAGLRHVAEYPVRADRIEQSEQAIEERPGHLPDEPAQRRIPPAAGAKHRREDFGRLVEQAGEEIRRAGGRIEDASIGPGAGVEIVAERLRQNEPGRRDACLLFGRGEDGVARADRPAQSGAKRLGQPRLHLAQPPLGDPPEVELQPVDPDHLAGPVELVEHPLDRRQQPLPVERSNAFEERMRLGLARDSNVDGLRADGVAKRRSGPCRFH